MILARRILPFVAPLGLAALYGALLYFPLHWRAWAVFITVFVFTIACFMMQWKVLTVRFWMMVFPICMLLLGGTGLLFFLRSPVLQFALVGFLVVMYGLYLEDVFILNYQQHKYSSLSLPNISFFMNTFASFCLFACGFALDLIGVIPMWLLTVSAFFFSSTILQHLFWSYHILDRKHAMTIVAIAVSITELVWVLQFWPTAFFVNAMLIAIVLYCVPSLVQLQLRNALSRKSLIRYVSISVLMIASIVTTSQWS